jgi:predicted adenylyl cyclase CyaB
MKEVEVLFDVLDKKSKVLGVLKKFKFLGLKEVSDIYFYDPLRGELKPDKSSNLNRCFRLRKKDEKSFLAYKIDRFDDRGIWLYSDEYETEVFDFKAIMQILKHLGFKKLIKIENKKYTFLTNKYEIILEDVKNLGLFLEVECLTIGDEEDVNNAKEEIRSFVKLLDIKIGKELNVGKPELMLRKSFSHCSKKCSN